MKMTKIKHILIAIIASSVLLLSGCSAHVDTTGKVINDTVAITYNSCSFLVPATLEASATDFVPMIGTHFETVEDRDIAKATLYTGTIKGLTEMGYMLSSPTEFFYIAKSDTVPDLLNCSRYDIINLVNRGDISIENYGRYIANADAQPKANMRIDFRVTTGNGTSRAYAGYIGVAITATGECYYYMAGYTYSTITEEQLKYCFDLVRSLR